MVGVKILVQHGARLDISDTMGEITLHHICIQDKSDTLETIFRLTSDPTIATLADHDGNTPLLDCLSHGSHACAMALLELEDIGQMIDIYGWYAAHHAVKMGNTEILKAVLKHSSSVKGVKTLEGKSLETIAMEASTWFGSIKSLIR